MISHRPCGVCGALVSADRGCEHWRPRMVEAWRRRRRSDEDTVVVEEFARVMQAEVPGRKPRRPLTPEERERATTLNRERRHKQRQELAALRAQQAGETG